MSTKHHYVHTRWRPVIQALDAISAELRSMARHYQGWEQWEIDALRNLYPLMTNRELAALFNRPPSCIKAKGGAKGLRLRKLPETVKRAYQEASANSTTRFKKGERPHSWVPVGSCRVTKDGTLQRKVSDRKGPPNLRWRSVHELVWIEHNGPVPDGHVVVFKPGQKTTILTQITIDRVECISWAENMQRNSVHTNYPKEVAQLIQLRGVLTRKINSRSKAA